MEVFQAPREKTAMPDYLKLGADNYQKIDFSQHYQINLSPFFSLPYTKILIHIARSIKTSTLESCKEGQFWK